MLKSPHFSILTSICDGAVSSLLPWRLKESGVVIERWGEPIHGGRISNKRCVNMSHTFEWWVSEGLIFLNWSLIQITYYWHFCNLAFKIVSKNTIHSLAHMDFLFVPAFIYAFFCPSVCRESSSEKDITGKWNRN